MLANNHWISLKEAFSYIAVRNFLSRNPEEKLSNKFFKSKLISKANKQVAYKSHLLKPQS